jgi:hypothetical protein
MDFATTFNTPVSIFGNSHYPLPECKYYQTKAALEPLKKIKKSTFPTKQAHVFIILHKNHKTYYSSNTEKYSPFHLPPSPLTPRENAKQFFKQQF